MELKLHQKYRALEPFEVQLTDLTVLTGVNGAGKTQILNGISQNVIQLKENGIELNPKKLVTNHTLLPNESNTVTMGTFAKDIRQWQEKYNSFKQIFSVNSTNPNPYKRLFEKIAERSGKNILDLSEDDFSSNHLLFDVFEQKEFFHQNFSSLFKRYHNNYEENQYKEFRHNKYNEKEIEFLSHEEFEKIYGKPPWELINKIFAEANLDYFANSPLNTLRDDPFEFKLINKINKADVRFNELSSGEKILMSLALALYNSKFDIEFPKVLLMDEPDASLHPLMAKQFLDVIQNVFVKDKGIKVIFTTHSPSTVALAPEEAIFVVNKIGQRIKKVKKDTALKILTAGVPSLSINYENRRQVFVESKNDAVFYEKIYEKIKNQLLNEVSLNFIPSGAGGAGNCKAVEEIVNKLTEFRNKSIFGIIDWDTTNKSSEHVRVLGEGNRYSIENYIFDPILVVALLLREKAVSRDDLGLKNNETYTHFVNLSKEQLQIISDFLIDKIEGELSSGDKTRVTVKYLNGIKVEIPKWYLTKQGHELENFLEEFLKNRYRELKRFHQSGDIKKEIVDKIIDDIPILISADILEVFKYIQTHGI